MKILLSILLISLSSVLSQAAVKTKIIDYKHSGKRLEGFLAYDDAIKGQRPGILIVHEWWGHGDYVRRRAKELAQLGYVAFALDMYGKGVMADNHKTAAKLSGVFRDNRKFMRKRAMAGLKVLKKFNRTQKRKIAAIGYCFGGTTVLELARSGLDLAGVVSFHGGLGTPHPEETKDVKAKVLICHGAEDGFTKPEDITAFQDEMHKAKVDWQMITYSDAVHGFTVKSAGSDASDGIAYNEKADKRSWQAMKNFLNEVLN